MYLSFVCNFSAPTSSPSISNQQQWSISIRIVLHSPRRVRKLCTHHGQAYGNSNRLELYLLEEYMTIILNDSEKGDTRRRSRNYDGIEFG